MTWRADCLAAAGLVSFVSAFLHGPIDSGAIPHLPGRNEVSLILPRAISLWQSPVSWTNLPQDKNQPAWNHLRRFLTMLQDWIVSNFLTPLLPKVYKGFLRLRGLLLSKNHTICYLCWIFTMLCKSIFCNCLDHI
jgi:hypothetical protein